MRLRFPAAILATVFLAACSSSIAPPAATVGPSATTGPLSAAGLARQIPGCAVYPGDVMAPELQDVYCKMPDGEKFEIATFTSSSDEAQWIADGSIPDDPSATYPGCCVQGTGWAAAIYDPGDSMHWNFSPVLKALGGRRVSG